ncbi:LEA family epithelial adhesin, partial [Lactobacillus sp. UMNPBX12]
MKRFKFLETKRTPRYSLRKLNVGVASVLLGVTIFGINFTNHSVKAATTESVTNSSPNSNSQQTLAAATTLQSAPKTQGSVDTDIKSSAAKSAATVDQNNTNTQKTTSATEKVQQNGASNDVTEKVQQNSASNDVTANNSAEAATTSQSAPKTQGSAHTDIKSLAAKSAAKLAFMNLMAASDTGTGTDNGTGTDRSGADVDQNNINDQPAKENQELANKTNLTSSDNYSSNIYQGKDGKYYKVVTIYGNDYVYHAADIQANGTARGQTATTAEDTKNNINISKEDLGNGKTRWTVVFFPHQGLQNVGSSLSGLVSAKFGIALTNDYQIVDNVDMEVINDPNQKYTYYKFEPGSNSATDITIKNPPAEVDFSFNPKTDVDPNTGLINNSKTLPAYDNRYLQPSYYFTTDTSSGKTNLWQTYFFNNGNEVYYNNAYDGTTPYLGDVHDFHFNNFIIKNKTGVDGLDSKDLNDPNAQIPIIYDTRNEFNSNGVFNSVNFNQAMEFKSHGYQSKLAWAGVDLSQHSSYVISFTTQHTDSHEVDLSTGSKNQQFSGISANIYSYQNGYYNMFSRLYGEQRALDPAGATVEANKIIPHWGDVKPYIDKIKQDYLNNAQINVLRNKILNNITDPAALNNIVSEGNSLNDAMKKLGNSIGQYDSDGKFTNHKVDTTKASDSYKYADSDKKLAYDNATKAVSNIISVEKGTVNKSNGTYADLKTVKALTDAENNAWNELNGVKKNATDAIKAINDAATAKKASINNSAILTNEEKSALVNQAQKLADDAITNINKATTNDAVNIAKENGVQAIKNMTIPTSSKTKNDANSDLDTTAAAAKNAIDETSGLTEDQKKTAKDQIDQAVTAAKDNIKKASDDTGVAAAKAAGKLAIDKVSANAAIDGALAEKNNSIDTAPNLTDEEKKAVKGQAKTVADSAKTAISNAKTGTDVESAKNTGVENIKNMPIPTSSKTKNDANSDLDTTAAAAKNAIDETSGLTEDQKKTAKDQIDQAVTAAKDNIKKASDDTGVAAAKAAGKLAIDKVSANAAIDGALAEKNNSIDTAPNLTDEEKKAVKGQAKTVADSAKTAISNAKTVTDVE